MNWITLHTPTNQPIYVFVGQVTCIRPPAGDAVQGGNSWVDFANGKSIATKETPAEIIAQIPATAAPNA